MNSASGQTRRSAISAIATGILAALLPEQARANSVDADLRHSLDALDALPDPATRIASLRRFVPANLSPSARIDLLAVRAGLGFDARLAALPPASPDRYALALGRACGASIDPAQAAARFEEFTAHLVRRSQQQFAKLNMSGSDPGTGFRALLANPRYAYADSDAGCDLAIADMNRWLAIARKNLRRWFGSLPPECSDVAARRLTSQEIAAKGSGFRILPGPGTRGSYAVDLRDIARRPSWTLRSVVHHELLPGHMVQLPMQIRANPHPLRLRYSPGFVEGWAIYAEILAWQGGMVDDPLEHLGAIHWLLFRMLRGLADIAIHHLGWSEARTVAMFEDKMGFPAYFAPFAGDVAHIASAPGLRAAEALTALSLASRAKQSADLRVFHAHMLGSGARPIALI